MKSSRVVLILVLLVALAAGLTWKFWPVETSSSVPATTPAVAVAPVAAKVTEAPKAAMPVAVVEAPKVAPAPAHDAPAASTTDLNVSPPNAARSGAVVRDPVLNTGASAAYLASQSQPADRAAVLAAKKDQLEKFKMQSQSLIDQAITNANGDPAALAKIDSAQKQYDAYIATRQKIIDDLEAQGP